ncbi:MAG: hypothetical protein N3B21_14055 [Clostridia bacterium]|nr:hypothetical protein [Clostridia bacterium]
MTYEDYLEKNYPEGYFEHYIEMFQSNVCQEGFEEHANIYIQIEGFDELKKLISEIELIKNNNDWKYFIELAKDYDREYLDLQNIKALAEAAIKSYQKQDKNY